MWSSRLFWRLFLVYGGLNFALAALVPLILSSWQKSLLVEQVRERLDGMAVVLVTHNPELAARGSRHLHMRDGHIEKEGS